jgi:hypothetical protein
LTPVIRAEPGPAYLAKNRDADRNCFEPIIASRGKPRWLNVRRHCRGEIKLPIFQAGAPAAASERGGR